MRLIATAFVLALLVASCEATATDTATTAPTVPATTSTRPPSVTTTRSASDLVGSANDAAELACADGLLTRTELETFKATLREIGVDTSSALARTALIVECGLSTDEVLDRLP